MKEMINDKMFINYKGKQYEIVFNLNVLEILQKKYGTFDKWTSLIQPVEKSEECDMEALIFAFCEAINEGIDIANEDREEKQAPLTMKQVGRIITEIGIAEANSKLHDAIIESAKSEEKNA